MDELPRGPWARPYAVAQTAPQQVFVGRACGHKGDASNPGFRLPRKLCAAIPVAGPGKQIQVSGTASLSGCVPNHGRPCGFGRRESKKATWPFGDIGPDQPLDDPVELARSYVALNDRWMSGTDLPRRLCGATVVGIPAALIVGCEGRVQ